MESLIIKDVDATASIHEYLSELIISQLRRHHQCQMTRIVNPGWMIFSTPHDRLFRPAQVTGHRRFNGVHRPLMKLLIAFSQASGEDMILPTIQLLWVALITRLLLLLLIALMIITTLVALITLIVMSTLITVES